MPDATALLEYYRTLTDQDLLNLKLEGGFTDEAERVLGKELARRNLGQEDLKRCAAMTERRNLQEEVTERGGGYRNIGFQLFGRRYLNEADKRDNIQIKTKWFTISGIPLIPIASYRFKCTDDSEGWFQKSAHQTVINRVSLDWKQVFITWVKAVALFIALILVVVGVHWIVDRLKH